MKRYVLVGIGRRSRMFQKAIANEFRDSANLLAICDKNPGRLELVKKQLKAMDVDVDSYPAENFDEMITVCKPDSVIVCTMDSTHDDYICRSLEAGCDVITEKPMTTDEKRCQRIIDTVKKTGKKVRVTFNYRYAPPRSQVKELLLQNTIGKILSVEYQYILDTTHGVDYFRRWHRNKANSGGLLVHKSTHHFDLINWWLSSVPESVFCKGQRLFYNQKQAKRYGLENHGNRCLDCKVSDKCNFYIDMKKYPVMKELYLDNESHDGYIRDRCVFGDEIDIEDSMNAVVQYKNGVLLSYSLNAFCPWEGYHIAINGTKGRIEHSCQESTYVSGNGEIEGALKSKGTSINVFPHFKEPYSVPIREGKGGHGGGDVVMLNDIFGNSQPDPLMRAADYIQGAYSILTGIAANESIASGKMVAIKDLCSGLGEPGFPEMPGEDDPIPYVKNVQCEGS